MEKQKEIKVFENPAFGRVRTIMVDDAPWFVGNDVAKALGYENTRDALAKHVDEEDKGVAKCDTLGGAQDLAIINESGVYSLIFSSKLPAARAFKRWVTSEVLPTLNRRGYYSMFGTDEELIAAIVRNIEDEEKLPIVLEALRLADIDQSIFAARLTGMSVEEYGKCKALINRASTNDYAKKQLKSWKEIGLAVYTIADLPDKFQSSLVVKNIFNTFARKHEFSDCFADYCGTVYCTAEGLRMALKKMARAGMDVSGVLDDD